MSRQDDQNKRKRLCATSIVLSLGLLLYFKYANFFVDNLNNILTFINLKNVTWSKIALPIGISFYTFQSISYTLDIYRKNAQPAKSISNYILYIIMFPQLIAGPIVKYNYVADSINSRCSTMEERVSGFYRFVIGLSKKVLVANVLASYADSVFNSDISTISSPTAWLGIFAYTFQIYFDFSGYSDMAIGIGKMLGFKFPENFNNPYTSQSISEFWRRWHITLGNFMKEYLYIPLGGNRQGKIRTYINLTIVFLLSGLWHGASYNFILWGAFHGFFLIADRLFMLKFLSRIGRLPSMAFTFLTASLGWVLFRSDNITQTTEYYTSLFTFRSGQTILPTTEFTIIFIIATIFAFITISKYGQRLNDIIFHKRYSTKTSTVMMIICTILLSLSIGSLLVLDFNPFIYFRF